MCDNAEKTGNMRKMGTDISNETNLQVVPECDQETEHVDLNIGKAGLQNCRAGRFLEQPKKVIETMLI